MAHISLRRMSPNLSHRLQTHSSSSILSLHTTMSRPSPSTHGGGWLTLTGVPVSQANQLLGASYQLHQHTGTNDSTILRTVSYALPLVLLPTHMKAVAPTIYFAPVNTLRKTARRPSVGVTGTPAKVGSRVHVTAMPSGRDSDEPRGITPKFLR